MRFLILLFFVLATPGYSLATLYSFVDEQGIRHYTNVPADSRAKKVQSNNRWATSGPLIRQLSVRNSFPYSRKMQQPTGAAGIDDYIRRASYLHQVDPLLIKAIIRTESNFNQFAVSSHGAQGLMQLMPGTARDLQVTDPFDAYQNISGGTKYIRTMLDNFRGNLELSLAAYNAGPGRVRFGKIPRIPETVAYVRKVMYHYRTYQRGTSPFTSINVRQLVTIN
jgi:soluble lytic murein transglycosylase-like protein